MNDLLYEIDEHGTVRAVHDDDDSVLPAVGAVASVERLSNVEWEAGGWTVRSAKDPTLALRRQENRDYAPSRDGTVVRFATRAAALHAERRFAWELRGEDNG